MKRLSPSRPEAAARTATATAVDVEIVRARLEIFLAGADDSSVLWLGGVVQMALASRAGAGRDPFNKELLP